MNPDQSVITSPALRTISLRTRRRRRARRAGLSPRGTARICRRARLPTTTCRAADCRAGVAKALAVWSRGECQTCIAACTSFRLNSGCWRVGTPPPPLAPRGVHPCGYRGESLPSRTAPPCSHPGSGHLSEIHVPGLPESGDNVETMRGAIHRCEGRLWRVVRSHCPRREGIAIVARGGERVRRHRACEGSSKRSKYACRTL